MLQLVVGDENAVCRMHDQDGKQIFCIWFILNLFNLKDEKEQDQKKADNCAWAFFQVSFLTITNIETKSCPMLFIWSFQGKARGTRWPWLFLVCTSLFYSLVANLAQSIVNSWVTRLGVWKLEIRVLSMISTPMLRLLTQRIHSSGLEIGIGLTCCMVWCLCKHTLE